jgi:hypothetical protein
MINHPQYTRVLRLPNNSSMLKTREVELADFVYTAVDDEMDTALVIKNRYGPQGRMSLDRVRTWMTHTLWHDVVQENQNPCNEIALQD